MFKKSNRNFRQKKAESDDEPDEEEKNALEAAKAVNLARNEEKLKAKVLSFKDEISLGDIDDDGSNEAAGGVGDGEEELGEFKVKKSRESRRIIKEMKKMRREKERQQQQKQEPTERADYNVPDPIVYNKNVSGVSVRGGGVTIDSKKEKGKYLVNKYGSGGGDEEADNGNGHNQDDDAKSDENQEEEEDHDEKLRVRVFEIMNVYLTISK